MIISNGLFVIIIFFKCSFKSLFLGSLFSDNNNYQHLLATVVYQLFLFDTNDFITSYPILIFFQQVIWPIDWALRGTTCSSQSGPRSNSTQIQNRSLTIRKSLVSYPGHPFQWRGGDLTPFAVDTISVLRPADREGYKWLFFFSLKLYTSR